MSRLREERGWAVVTAMMLMAIMISVAIASFSFVDSQARQSGTERNRESSYDYAEGVLSTEAYLVAAKGWPGTSPGFPDCTYTGAGLVASGGNADSTYCPAPSQLSGTFAGRDYTGSLLWTVRVRDNGGTDTCAVTNKLQCSYFYDDSSTTSQPAYDANGDGQLWVRAQVTFRNQTRTLVERAQVNQQPVNFPAGAVTAYDLLLGGSPHIKVVTNYTPINLRCAINTANCPGVKPNKHQIAPYRFTFSYPQQQAIPTAALNLLRQRAKNEGWYYATCPNLPPGTQVFVESGSCKGNSLPATSPTSKGTYIQASGTLTLDDPKQPRSPNAAKGRKGNYWGLIYLANSSKLTGNVLNITKGKRWLQGVFAVDYNGSVNLSGSKDTQLQYDPFVIQGLYLYEGSSLVKPSFREINATAP